MRLQTFSRKGYSLTIQVILNPADVDSALRVINDLSTDAGLVHTEVRKLTKYGDKEIDYLLPGKNPTADMYYEFVRERLPNNPNLRLGKSPYVIYEKGKIWGYGVPILDYRGPLKLSGNKVAPWFLSRDIVFTHDGRIRSNELRLPIDEEEILTRVMMSAYQETRI